MHKYSQKMKKTICLLYLVYTTLSAFSQAESTTDLENFSIMSPVQSGIYEAKGWSIQDNGKWAYAMNKIPHTDSKSNNARPGGLNELGQDNFYSLELRKS